MKKTILVVALFVTAFVQKISAQDSTKNWSSSILTSYYGIKDALVNGNASAAALSAEAFMKAAAGIDKGIVSEESLNALSADAVSISQTKDIKVQREKFALLSGNMFVLAKTVKLSNEPLYQQYCPMKKASWLSDKKVIKNPYYGNAMLSCGSVKEIL